MALHRNTRVVLAMVRDFGAEARIDDDGDIVVRVDGRLAILSVSDEFVVGWMVFETSVPPNALAVVARKLHQRVKGGRLVFPDEGGTFALDYAHRYNGVPSSFDTTVALVSVFEVADIAAKIADEFGYRL